MPDLDDFDRRLLAALQDDARLTNAELGERVGLSASQCSRRRMALERDGLIRGYRADLSPEAAQVLRRARDLWPAFAEATGVRLPASNSDTVAGFVIEQLGRLARIGDTVDVGDVTLKVTALDGRRISELTVAKRVDAARPDPV